MLAVLLVGAQAEIAQPPREPALHELALVRAEHDAGVLADHVADELELGIAERGP